MSRMPPNSKAFIFVIAFLYLLFTAISLIAQTLPFKNYTTADGLGHDFLGKIVRDSHGFLWFCTGEGLSRFDGYEFKNYTQADGLPHRNINDLLELEDGTYLIATSDGLVSFDPKGESQKSKNPNSNPMFRTFRPNIPKFENQPFGINSLYQKRDGEILATTYGILFRLIKQTNEWQFQKVELKAWGDKSIEFFSVIEDKRGKMWSSTGEGVWYFDESSGSAIRLTDDPVTKLIEDREGRIWAGIGDSPRGLSLFTYPEGQDTPVLTRRFTTKDGLTDDRWIHTIFETSNGRILAGIRNGVCEFQPDAKAGEPSFRPISTVGVVSLGEDVGGNLWLGTAVKGAVKLTRQGFVFYDIPEKQPYGTATSIFEGNDNELYLTSSDRDLLRFDNNRFSQVKLSGFTGRSWGWNQLDLRSKIDGEWWIPTGFGLFRYPATTKF
ncbi:MAG TPA: hypothetical protein PKY82_23205, partial [Pyrinomonadaceae bacterium]|nr:hypothetical protein [Pyrinomonadaceae bacterium]